MYKLLFPNSRPHNCLRSQNIACPAGFLSVRQGLVTFPKQTVNGYNICAPYSRTHFFLELLCGLRQINLWPLPWHPAVTAPFQIPKQRGTITPSTKRITHPGGVTAVLPLVCVLPNNNNNYYYSAMKLGFACLTPVSLTSCCMLQPPAPAQCRTGWHRSRAPAPTRWWRRPSSAPRPLAPAPCPRLLLGGPPACFRYERSANEEVGCAASE